MSGIVMCDECGLFEIPAGAECCRVCMSFNRSVPLDDMTALEFDSFRHRMMKKEREDGERVKKNNAEEKRIMVTRNDAMSRVLREREIGNYAGKLKVCVACDKFLSHSEVRKYGCYSCYKGHIHALRTTGMPYVGLHPNPKLDRCKIILHGD